MSLKPKSMKLKKNTKTKQPRIIFCANCKKNITGKVRYIVKGKVYCESCYLNLDKS
ncbi:MAG TPA: hypothetical protein ENK99_07750 [Campylobacterales bacterium]|nr:hypothetical protein [Campylobacterales bacterium]